MKVPVLVLLEAGKPLVLLAAQLLWIAEPLANLVSPGNEVSQWAGLLEQPETVPDLIARLEEEAR
jgi:hypothetical protein